jgi:serine/threonine-protein kinase HipA
MSVNGKFDGIARADLLAVADRFQVPGAKGLLADVAASVGDWTRFAAEAEVPAAKIVEIAKDFRPV